MAAAIKNYEFDTFYIVTKGNSKGTILKGDTLKIEYRETKEEHSSTPEYTVFLPDFSTGMSLWGMKPLNRVLYFKTEEELSTAMEGVELKYNTDLVLKLIKEKQTEIDRLKSLHKIG